MGKALSHPSVLGGGEDQFTVGIRHGDNSITRLFKVGYAKNDCSYYVFFPYHPYCGTAVLGKFTVNYARREQLFSHEEMHDIAGSDDESNGIKLSHHRSGFVQFSGGGIISGPGKPGIQIQSWPLSKPVPGPAFGVSMLCIDGYSKKAITDVECLFPSTALIPTRGSGVLVIEGFYFPWEAIKHTRLTPEGEREISIRRPLDGKALQLKVLTPPAKCWNLGFVAVHANLEPVHEDQKMEGFFVTTVTGNLYRNEANEMLGDSLILCYPRVLAPRRSVDYHPPRA